MALWARLYAEAACLYDGLDCVVNPVLYVAHVGWQGTPEFNSPQQLLLSTSIGTHAAMMLLQQTVTAGHAHESFGRPSSVPATGRTVCRAQPAAKGSHEKGSNARPKQSNNDSRPGKAKPVKEAGRKPSATRGRKARANAPIKPASLGSEAQDACWRVYQVAVAYSSDPGKDDISVSDPLRTAVIKKLGCKSSLPASAIQLVRKSFDSRRLVKGVRAEKKWVYVVDVDAAAVLAAGGHVLTSAPGVIELVPRDNRHPTLSSLLLPKDLTPHALTPPLEAAASANTTAAGAQSPQAVGSNPGGDLIQPHRNVAPVVVVGSGPAGLFAALTAAEAGLPVLVLERGQPVEQRGKDIGALLVRGLLDPNSNLCYGEGGAGTWSDGKLATKIGRNSDPVRAVLAALVQFGAPESILVVGKPHLGTDRLVRILKSMRLHLLEQLGAQIRFGCMVDDLEVTHGRVTGVVLAGSGEVVRASSVVLAVGHSARTMYRRLLARGVQLAAKPFAMGFRIEHPQQLIDEARYGQEHAGEVLKGKGPIPVADYKLNAEVQDDLWAGSTQDTSARRAGDSESRAGSASGATGSTVYQERAEAGAGGDAAGQGKQQSRFKPVEEYSGGGRPVPAGMRGVFSFCMCPGGQIVCTSTTPEQLCLNGMSFSKRNSQWANSALVVNIRPEDWTHHTAEHGVLAGVALQEEIETEAARRGGGNLVAPVQRVVDFLSGQVSTGSLPASSYRLGVKSAALHDIYPPFVSAALAKALERFEHSIPGFMSSPEALLHGVETRTSAPVRVERQTDTCESPSLPGLYPCGEGAGYAGGIVSAAVDGIRVGQAIVQALLPAASLL